MARLLALFVLVPIAEFYLLVAIGRRIGVAATLALIVATGALGAFLARRQGLDVLERFRHRQPGATGVDQILDGVIILLAGAVLITPGVLTDAFGFFCLTPAGRGLIKRYLNRRFEARLKGGDGFVAVDLGDLGRGDDRPMRDVTPRRDD